MIRDGADIHTFNQFLPNCIINFYNWILLLFYFVFEGKHILQNFFYNKVKIYFKTHNYHCWGLLYLGNDYFGNHSFYLFKEAGSLFLWLLSLTCLLHDHKYRIICLYLNDIINNRCRCLLLFQSYMKLLFKFTYYFIYRITCYTILNLKWK